MSSSHPRRTWCPGEEKAQAPLPSTPPCSGHTHTLAGARELPVAAKDPQRCPGSQSVGTSVVLRLGLVACPDGPIWLCRPAVPCIFHQSGATASATMPPQAEACMVLGAKLPALSSPLPPAQVPLCARPGSSSRDWKLTQTCAAAGSLYLGITAHTSSLADIRQSLFSPKPGPLRAQCRQPRPPECAGQPPPPPPGMDSTPWREE